MDSQSLYHETIWPSDKFRVSRESYCCPLPVQQLIWSAKFIPKEWLTPWWLLRYKQGHPESQVVAIHWFDNPYGQPNIVPRGIDHMASRGPYFSHGPRDTIANSWFDGLHVNRGSRIHYWQSAEVDCTIQKLWQYLYLISSNKLLSHVDWRTSFYRSPSTKNSMGRQVQGECYEPSHGPVPETTTWDEFYPADLEATTSLDASATV